MILQCSEVDNDRIMSYIGEDYAKCLYLYLDLEKFGFESDEVEVFSQINDDEKITAVLLKYYSCVHVYSANNDFNVKELVGFIEKHGFNMVYCTAKTAELIFEALPENLLKSAFMTTGWVAQISKVDKAAKGLATMAQKQDFKQIVQLIYEDEDIGKSYKFEELSQQIMDRNSSGYARNLVIKEEKTVIAHACTNAELDNIAVVAELLVHGNYRRKGYATEIWRDLCDRLLKENKEVYSFYYSDESRALHKKVGFKEVCTWAKIVFLCNTDKV